MTSPILEQQRAHYAGVKARLYRAPPKAIIRPIPLAASPAVVPEPEPIKGDAPLNMLAPCSWRFLLALTAVRHELSPRIILGKSRQRKVLAARSEAMASIYRHTQASLPQVGRMLNRDHSTVLHALRKLHGGSAKLVDSPTRDWAPAKIPDVLTSRPAPTDPDELAEENRQLRLYIGSEPDRVFFFAASQKFGLSPSQITLLQMLMTGKPQSLEMMQRAISTGEDPSTGSLRVQISKMRMILFPFGIEILNVYSAGYVMLEDSRIVVSGLLAEAQS